MTDLDASLAAARALPGRALLCVKTDRTANRSAPLEVLRRFGEAYQGPAA